MKPEEKDPSIDALLKQVFGKDRIDSINKNKCTWCGKEVGTFKDALSKKEYGISGFCQSCQDDTFGED